LRLTNIKISGFKSFVDKTELTLSTKRTAIIGPNGCGKSNIIDAVKWVLGETSKHIRGDNIDDVIFNGTDTRKPNDYANVELLFSNTENRIGGQYAQYDEISVKREVTRDGASKYFLNNSHCRRRDILDIFMGTGLGPKSYAIINQGTASKLIESKPEEFRVYLEEVAGISKYRERKRETENKIKHTKENLDRLNDVVSEVTKQLKILERQAIQADKYKKLSEEKKSIKAEILAISIRDFQEKIENNNKKIETKKTKLEKKQLEISNTNLEINKIKEAYQEQSENMNNIQKEYYDALSEVGRTEQAIEYEKAGAERNKQQYEDALKSIEKLQDRLNSDNDQLVLFQKEIKELHTKQQQYEDKKLKLESDSSNVKNEIITKKNDLEKNLKNLYEYNQDIKLKEEKLNDYDNNIVRIKKDIIEYSKTSEQIYTELKKIESYELDLKIKNYKDEINKLKNHFEKKDNSDIRDIAKKIQEILESIQNIVKNIQSNEYDLAKKNEKIKKDIDNKINSETKRLNELISNVTEIKNLINISDGEIKNFENICKQTSETIEDLEKNHNIILSNLDTNNISFRENELSIETKKIQVVNLENNISINNNELQSLSGNIKILQDNSSAPDNKLDDLENQLNEKLKIQNIKDTELKSIREKISDLSENISLLESEKSEKSLLVENLRNEISDDEKDIQGIIGQVKGIKDQLAEMGIDNISILDADINYDLSKWKKRENELTNAIERMGAINMAAIDQFKEYEERKSYLVMQKDDLLDALESLEEAIKKIDKDTKERFKETFDKVDNKLQEIFPK